MTDAETPVQPHDVPGAWEVLGTEDLFRGALPFALRADLVRAPHRGGAEPFRRVIVEHPGAVVVLAADDDDRVCCLRHYRHPVGATLVELPAGLRDVDGEDAVAVGRRELAEEVELQAEVWTPLLSTYSSPGLIAERIDYLLARGLSPASRGDFVLRDEEAEIEVLWVPFPELYDAVLDGRVRNGPTATAVLSAAARGLLGTR